MYPRDAPRLPARWEKNWILAPSLASPSVYNAWAAARVAWPHSPSSCSTVLGLVGLVELLSGVIRVIRSKGVTSEPADVIAGVVRRVLGPLGDEGRLRQTHLPSHS